MAKPKINISFANGSLGTVTPLPSGVFGLIASAVAVPDKFELNTAYQLKSMADVVALGINGSVTNYNIYKTLSEFFAEAGEGSEIWLMGVSKSTKVSDWFKLVSGVAPAETLLNAANGKLRGLFTSYAPTTAPELDEDDAIDPDVITAAAEAHALFEHYSAKKYAPFFTILEGYAFTGNKTKLPNLKSNDYNSVGILIGDTEMRAGTTSAQGAAIGVIAGRLAKSYVRENIGKVKNGALSAQQLYIVDTPVESFDTEALYDLGYITFVTHQGIAGYFFMDDPTATSDADDYCYLSRRRTINEAFRLAYQANINFLLDEVPVNKDGTIQASYAKAIEQAVESKIITSMGNDLVNHDGDYGVKCFIDLSHNVVSTSKLKEVVRIRPWGYDRWIDVEIGYELQK